MIGELEAGPALRDTSVEVLCWPSRFRLRPVEDTELVGALIDSALRGLNLRGNMGGTLTSPCWGANK
jgi:hypothetical protein